MSNLTGVDVLGIQRFVFASSKVRDVVGASWLVKQATDRGGAALNAAGAPAPIVAAGGNVLLKTSGGEKDFARAYTRWMLENAPGLDVAVAHQPYEAGFVDAVRSLWQALDRAKAAHRPSVPLLGFSVSATCRQTGLPANTVDRFDGPISRVIETSRGYVDEANARWEALIPATLPDSLADLDGRRLAFPLEIENLGGTRGDTSLIGVVHIDGNGIGSLINHWLDEATGTDAEIERRFQKLSLDLDSLGAAAMQTIVNRVAGGIERVRGSDGTTHYQFGSAAAEGAASDLRFRLRSDEQALYLPLRPVLLGGDDLTFLCDGRIALDLAVTGLRAFRAQAVATEALRNAGACAGVAIVHAHWPFRRAVELANELCSSAKKEVQGRPDSLAIDWHIAATKPGETVSGLRKRQYEGRRLTCRPYTVGSAGLAGPGSWEWLEETLLAQWRREPWVRHRNKVKALASLSRDGEHAVREALADWERLDEDLKLPAETASGFAGSRSPLLDAAELLDIHLRCGA